MPNETRPDARTYPPSVAKCGLPLIGGVAAEATQAPPTTNTRLRPGGYGSTRLGADYRPPSYTPIIPLAPGLPRGDSLAATFRRRFQTFVLMR